MVGASQGLGEAMVGVPSSRRGPPSFGTRDAVSDIEATCCPSASTAAFVLVDTTLQWSIGEPELIHKGAYLAPKLRRWDGRR